MVTDTGEAPDGSRDYDRLSLSALHSDFDRARQISHASRRRGAKTVLGGPLASTFPQLCAPWFDAVAVGDPEELRDHSENPGVRQFFSRKPSP